MFNPNAKNGNKICLLKTERHDSVRTIYDDRFFEKFTAGFVWNSHVTELLSSFLTLTMPL